MNDEERAYQTRLPSSLRKTESRREKDESYPLCSRNMQGWICQTHARLKNKQVFIVFLPIVGLSLMPTLAADIGALPPSKHILSYERFIADNSYAGEYISINAKIREIRSARSGDLSEYHIKLMSLNDTGISNKPWLQLNILGNTDLKEAIPL